MKVSIPRHTSHPVTRLNLITPNSQTHMLFDDSHSEVEVSDSDDLKIVAEFCLPSGKVDESITPVVLKEAKKRPQLPPPPKTDPPKPKADPPKAETRPAEPADQNPAEGATESARPIADATSPAKP